MVFGILFIGVVIFIIIQSVVRIDSSSNSNRFEGNRRNDAANMSFMAASHPDLLDTNNPNHSNHHQHHHHEGDSHHHSSHDSGSHSWGGDSGHSGGGDFGGGDSGGGGGCD
ncbi:hypothetical protein MHH52_07410 [Paenibacillus sp. FSL K6-0276]|uniref:hypothetical protein n=1 Tax=Paenibacillus sp. FSL K6-0276 TaxID=2921450 RepID=UPI0030EE857E